MTRLTYFFRVVSSLMVLLLFCLLAPATQAIPGQPGTLDAFWATGSPLGPGKAITPFGTGENDVLAIALQPDGKVLLAGSCAVPGDNWQICAIRYQTNGTLDPSFGNGGVAITPFGDGYASKAQAIALQADGKLILAGWCMRFSSAPFGPICAVRYNTDGTLDTTFGTSGRITATVSSINNSNAAYALTLQPDGKFVLAGSCSNGTDVDFCALRYRTDGTLDPDFGAGGKVITLMSNGEDSANAIALQPDGKILLAGYCSNGSNLDFCAARYHPNGSLDSSFNTTGKVLTAIGAGIDAATAVALQPDGKIVLAGACSNGSNRDFCALRYEINGSLDSRFGTLGKVLTPIGATDDAANALALQSDGKLLVVGSCSNGIDDDFCLLRYHPNGVLDASFNGSGKVTTAVGAGIDWGKVLTLQPDGKIVVGGTCAIAVGGVGAFCAARYDGGPFGYKNCSLDIDGDNRVLATTDSLIHARIALGITGSDVTNGITFPPTATRNTWPLIRDYLVTQCGMSLVQ